ncbi:toxin secretion/phage lysis holin [Weissella uvarum]|nr:phage holin family protein [Weissella uvarum]MBM7617313.1 toxin secretion/phage lysis holin [Weissella uvarum]
MMIKLFEQSWPTKYYLLLVALVFADLVLGFGRAVVLHKFNSTIGLVGIIKHVMILLIPFMLYPFVAAIGYSGVADGIILFLVMSQGGSVLENWVALGLPFKAEWKNFFDDQKLAQKTQYGSTDESNHQ